MWDEREIHELVLGSTREDAAAQRALYTAAYPYGLTVALYYSDNRQSAEEVLQDSFLKLFQSLPHLDDLPQSFLPWFRRIVVNTAIDAYRRRQRDLRIVPLPAQMTFNAAVDRLNTEDLYQLLQSLPPSYRLVFNLYVLEGYSHPEIADRLHISVGSSKSNLHKARRHLKRLATPFFNPTINFNNA
ncbi:RNA polymerase sigma-70 factor (ECF subfamily) [Neolewinella xylanilytica]|uniref:RNA polymerase sigma-70 factor (ECF subfamily) n=1 Tax=Neolewinella xylanilytica TaxID=1514080 RepID=A0A2S6I8H1_9BACT|nr:RNA polymerase sigma factor [Neolewinella xylanilytica]PPK87794.1 RNA polymerase sigma-70 factor (ECF subfamily) [Neolewinella xylanilytica]